MFDLASFAKNYSKALNDIFCILPKGTEVPSFAGMMQMDSVLQTWIATGGMLASSVRC